MNSLTRLSKLQLIWTAAGSALSLTSSLAASADLDFYRDIYPALKANCISCHNKTTTKADLNMESPEMLLKGGETGPGLIPGKGAESLVVQAAVHTKDLVMPPKNNKTGAVNLKPSEIALLRTWIDQGAKSSVQQARQVVWQPLPPGIHPIYTVAMTKDGRSAACGRANQIFVYDLATRKFTTRLTDDALSKQNGSVAHRALVQGLAFSPDGSRLASGSFREVKIWRQEKAKPIARKADPALGLVATTLSSDGTQIIAADKKGAVIVQDAASGKVLKTIPAVNAKGIKSLSLSPNGSLLLVGGMDGTLAIWNLADGKSMVSPQAVPNLNFMSWASNGDAFVTASKSVAPPFLWLAPGFAAPLNFEGTKSEITAISMTGNAHQLVSASSDGKVRLWKDAGQKPEREFSLPNVLSLATSRDGKQLAAGCADGAVRVWDLAAGKQIIELRGDIESGKRMAVLDWTAAAQGLDFAFQTKEVARIEAENKALEELLKKANETIATVKKVLPEKQAAVKPAQDAKATAQTAADAITAQIAKLPEGKTDAALEKQNTEAQAKLMTATTAETAALAAVKASEHHIADAEMEVKNITAAKAKNTALIAAANVAITAAKAAQTKAAGDLATAKQQVAKDSKRPLAVAFSADSQDVAAIFNDGGLRVWAVTSGLPIEQVPGSGPTTAASITATPDGSFVACTAEGAVSRVSTSSRWVLERVLGGEKADSPLVDRVNAVRFSPDGQTLAVGGGEPSRSGDISLWDVATGKVLKNWSGRHADAVLSLDFSPNGKLLASGGSDKIAQVTDIATGKQVRLYEGHTHHVMGVAFRADGRVLATAGGDGVVLVWDMIMGERKKKIEGWSKEVTSLQFIGATNQIVTSAGDNLIRIINDEGTEVRAIAKLPDFMQSAASTATASVLIGGGEDSFLRVWDGSNGKELASFGAK